MEYRYLDDSCTACDTFRHKFLLLRSFASCFLFSWFRDNRNLEAKDSLTDSAVCMTVLRRWTWSLPLAGLQSFQACTGHWSAVYGPVLQSTNGVVEVERWHAAEGTGGGNCFPSICRPRVTLAICSSRNALYSLNTCQRVLLFACTVLYTHDGGMRVIQYCNNIVFYIDPLLRPY